MRLKACHILFTITLIPSMLISACSATAPSAALEEVSITPTSPSTTSSIQEPILLTDGLDRTITLATPAQRVVSLAPSNTEILFAIGAGTQVVGRDTFSDYPTEATAVTEVGGGFGELNTEVILDQKPDLILASSLTPPEQIKALEDLELVVFALANPKDFEGMFENVLDVAQLTGHEPEAEALIEGLKARVSAVEEKINLVVEHPLVFYELDGTDPNAPWTSGPGTFIDTLIGMAGGENLGNSLGSEWAQISIEELIAKNPDIILLGSAHWGGVSPEDVKVRTGWEALDAIKNGNIFTFDDNLVSRPGPRLVDGLEAMAKLLHPELFE